MKEQKLLLIPGPSPVVDRILEALAQPTVSHISPQMEKELGGALENMKKIVFTASGQPFIVAGAGTLAMEIALLNIAADQDRVLVLSQGYFGNRMAEICEAFDIKYHLLQSPWGRVVTAEELRAELKNINTKLWFAPTWIPPPEPALPSGNTRKLYARWLQKRYLWLMECAPREGSRSGWMTGESMSS